MQRRGESGQPAKEQRTTRPKARKAPTAHVSNAALQEELGRAMRERDEALEQLAATSGVLQVISSMPGDLEPVFHLFWQTQYAFARPSSEPCTKLKAIPFGVLRCMARRKHSLKSGVAFQ